MSHAIYDRAPQSALCMLVGGGRQVVEGLPKADGLRAGLRSGKPHRARLFSFRWPAWLSGRHQHHWLRAIRCAPSFSAQGRRQGRAALLQAPAGVSCGAKALWGWPRYSAGRQS